MSYDGAVTIFTPDGHLKQVEYAVEAVRKGSAVGLRTQDCIVFGVEKKPADGLQIERFLRKIHELDGHIIATYAGLTADARVVMKRARDECQTHRLNFENAASVEYIAKYICKLKQQYTQSNGRRPFGIAFLIAGFDDDGQPHLYVTEPSGNSQEFIGNAAGRSSQTVREFLEQHVPNMAQDEQSLIKLVVRSLLAVTPFTKTNMEVAVLKYKQPLQLLDVQTIADLVKVIEQQNEQEAKKQII